MFVRLSARSRTRRLCEDTRIRIVLPFLLDLRRRKCKRISRTARPARKLHAHTRQKRNGERKRQSWLAKSVVVLVYSARLQIVFSSQQESMMNEKRHETKRNAEGMKNGCQRWMQNAGVRRHVMNECIENWWTKEISLHPFVTWSPRFLGSVYSGMFQCWTGIQVEHRGTMNESIFYSSVNVPWTSLLSSFAAGKPDEWKMTWKRDDAIGMKNGCQQEMNGVRMNERIHRESIDESVIYSNPLSTCADKGVCRERREHHVCFFPSRESWTRPRVAIIARLFVAI
jgi:hypothetical protein